LYSWDSLSGSVKEGDMFIVAALQAAQQVGEENRSAAHGEVHTSGDFKPRAQAGSL
jgi:hypothetical protein